MTLYKAWLSAFRLRTLPLALASIGMGSFLAAAQGAFRLSVFGLCVLTTIFLQILSNLANDFGDSIHGADSVGREGPSRAVQSGAISSAAMKRGIMLFVLLSLLSGLLLLYVALGFHTQTFLFFLILGLLSIVAAIGYTVGGKPYGYIGLGDLSVLLFFGLIGVMGSHYLYSGQLDLLLLLPAMSCGLFSVAVLNVNNIRDIVSDRAAGKLSIPVRIGREKAVVYHWLLIAGGLISALLYSFLSFQSYAQFLFLIAVPLLAKNALAVKKYDSAKALDPYLKQMALSTLLFVLSFGIGLLLS